MYGWSLVLTPEVNGWLCGLDDATFGRVAYHLDALWERGVRLGEPRSRPLRPGQPIRQLTIPDGRRTHRLTYCLDGQGPGQGVIVALTVRRWWRPARWELHRARDALAQHHGHHPRARPARGRRRRHLWREWRLWRDWQVWKSRRGRSGWWRRPGRGGCGTVGSGPGRERA